MPTPEQVRETVERYVKARDAGDKDAWIGVFAEHAEQIDPYPQPANVGREAIATFWDNVRALVDGFQFTVHQVTVAGDRAAVVFTLTMQSGDTKVAFDGVDVFEIDDDFVARLTAYWDPAAMRLL
jgi:ketosteroid isomerase-like protein